jgi:hypothetical protein
VPSPQIAHAEGEGGINLELAQRLLQIKIRLEAEQSHD